MGDVAEYPGAMEDDLPVLAVGDAAAVDAMMQPLAAFEAGGNLWNRCLVSDGRRPAVNVYFDGGTHQSGRPRGFAHCNRHECKRYIL